jgi:hypothetical protein
MVSSLMRFDDRLRMALQDSYRNLPDWPATRIRPLFQAGGGCGEATLAAFDDVVFRTRFDHGRAILVRRVFRWLAGSGAFPTVLQPTSRALIVQAT